jgi:type II secretory pathway pseudopilin PulG
VTARRHLHGPEAGIALVEGLLVVAIVGTLLALAVPTFVGRRSHDQDAAAQHSLRTALTAADVAFTTRSTYTDAGPTALAASTPALTFTSGDVISAGPDSISIADDAALWAAAAQSDSGSCYFIAARSSGRVFYGSSSDGLCDGYTARTAAHRTSW